jgi:hypothetical protein
MVAFLFAAALAAQSPPVAEEAERLLQILERAMPADGQACAAAPAATAKTIASAQAYLCDVLSRGTAKVIALDEDGAEQPATIQTVAASGCTTTFRWDRGRVGRVVDWSLISSVSGGYYRRNFIMLEGSTKTLDGQVIARTELEVESQPTRNRVVKAMDFLREHCDKSNGDIWSQ